MTCKGMYFSLNPGFTERIASLTIDSDSAVNKEFSSADVGSQMHGLEDLESEVDGFPKLDYKIFLSFLFRRCKINFTNSCIRNILECRWKPVTGKGSTRNPFFSWEYASKIKR